MSFRFRYSQDSQGEDLGLSSCETSQPSQEMMMRMPPLLSQSQSQSFIYDLQPQPQPRQSSYASRIRNLQLQPNNQKRYGARDPRVLRQQRSVFLGFISENF